MSAWTWLVRLESIKGRKYMSGDRAGSDDKIIQSRQAGKRKMLKEIVEVFLNKLILFYLQNSFLLEGKIKKTLTVLSLNILRALCAQYGEGNGTPLQYSCLENPMDGGAWWAAVHGVARSRTRLSNFTFPFHVRALEKEMATHSSVLAWRIPGTGEPGGLPSLGSHRVGHDWSDLA